MEERILKEEQQNLDKTMLFLTQEMSQQMDILTKKRNDLKDLHRYMWSDYVPHTMDKEQLKDITQLFTLYHQTANWASNTSSIVNKYERLLRSPYFGRFDIIEEGLGYPEKIYIGFYNLIDLKNGIVYIYDWRSPIAGVYYRFELGECFYDAPDGRISGEVTLKRQIKIENSELKFFVDLGLVINDDILLQALSLNATNKMKTIVETIQKEQDLIIRDIANDILIVNGVAGSGKTSIALHRIAYLLYETKVTKITHNNIIVFSPSEVFGEYIEDVLPNLGEEPVKQETLDGIYSKFIKKIHVQKRYKYLESLMRIHDAKKLQKRLKAFEFKTSEVFVEILDRFALLYERRLHEFEDIFLDGKIIYTKSELKALFLDNKAKFSAASRLERIKNRVVNDAMSAFEPIRSKLETLIKNNDKYAFEEEIVLDSCINKIKNRFLNTIRRQLTINPMELYQSLIGNKKLFSHLSKGLFVPKNVEVIFNGTQKAIENGFLPYEDAAAVLYLTEKLFSIKDYSNIRHVVIDEAQDYSPMTYTTIKKIFPNAKYTILGDINQSIAKNTPKDFFLKIADLLKNPKTTLLNLTKSYRSSYEIHEFCNKILGYEDSQAFVRNGQKPEIITGERRYILDKITEIINNSPDEENISILTKTMPEAEDIYNALNINRKKTLLNKSNERLGSLNVMPCYMAKGLEFDSVIVWGADDTNYSSSFDKNLLYVACTRALHRLYVCAENDLSQFIKK